MNTRATILAALMGSTILAGAALAQGSSDMSLSAACVDGYSGLRPFQMVAFWLALPEANARRRPWTGFSEG